MVYNPNQPRDPLGKWVEEQRASSGLQLTDDRRYAVHAGDDVPPALAEAAAPANSTRNIARWWRTAFESATYSTGGTVPKMPDDNTPGMTGGRALTGHRRTHRMRYQVGDVELRMPSRTAIKRYMSQEGINVLDVPVVATIDGQSIATHVRVTQNIGGTYEAVAYAAPGDLDVLVAESVSATLERRSPSYWKNHDLYEHRQLRRALYGIRPGRQVVSTFITSVSYDDKDGTAFVAMGDRAYKYKVDRGTWEKFAERPDVGRAFNQLIKPTGATEKLVRCPECQRYRSEEGKHLCPVMYPRAFTESTFIQQLAVRKQQREWLPPTSRPNLSSWKEKTPAGTGWTRALVATTLYDCSDRVAVPEAYERGRNGANGTLHFNGLKGRDLARTVSDKVGGVDLVDVSRRHPNVSVGGTVYAPVTGREGITYTHVNIDDPRILDAVGRPGQQVPYSTWTTIARQYGLGAMRPSDVRVTNEGVRAFF